MPNPVLQINQFTDGPTGHVNTTLVAGDGSKITYGANLSPGVGVQIETDRTSKRIADNPSAYSFHDITLTQAQYNAVLAFAQAADAGNNAYAVFCNNCVDFADRALAAAGFGRFAIANYLKDGTLTDVYAELAKYICVDGNWMYSGYDAPDFTDPTAANAVFQSAFGYQPDWSWTGDVMDMFDLLQSLMGKSAFDEEMKWARQAWLDAGGSPIAIDLNGDGLVTTNYTPSNVYFDVTGDGVTEKTAWLSSEDAFLVVDRNANRKIDDVNEMFGGLQREEGYKEQP